MEEDRSRMSAFEKQMLIATWGARDTAGNMYTIGWPMRGVLLKTTAVRELRVRARILAEELIASLSADVRQYSVGTS